MSKDLDKFRDNHIKESLLEIDRIMKEENGKGAMAYAEKRNAEITAILVAEGYEFQKKKEIKYVECIKYKINTDCLRYVQKKKAAEWIKKNKMYNKKKLGEIYVYINGEIKSKRRQNK